jgi:hypothetical protein
MVIFHSYVNVYQRVYPIGRPGMAGDGMGKIWYSTSMYLQDPGIPIEFGD